PSVVKSENLVSGEPKHFLLRVKRMLDARLQILAFTFSDVYVFSNTTKKQIMDVSKLKLPPKIVNPGINLQRFSLPSLDKKNNIRNKIGIPLNKKVILCLGRFSGLKQFELVIKSMEKLSDEYYLAIVGDGPEGQNYKILSESSN